MLKKGVSGSVAEILLGALVAVIFLVIAIYVFTSVASSRVEATNLGTFNNLKDAIVKSADGSVQTIPEFTLESDSDSIVYGIWYISPELANEIISAADRGYFSFYSEDDRSILKSCYNKLNDACVCLFKFKLLDIEKRYVFDGGFLDDYCSSTAYADNGRCYYTSHEDIKIRSVDVPNLVYLPNSGSDSLSKYNAVANYLSKMECNFVWDHPNCQDSSCSCTAPCTTCSVGEQACINGHKYLYSDNTIFIHGVDKIKVLGCFSMVNDLNCRLKTDALKPCILLLKTGEYTTNPLVWIGTGKGAFSTKVEVSYSGSGPIIYFADSGDRKEDDSSKLPFSIYAVGMFCKKW